MEGVKKIKELKVVRNEKKYYIDIDKAFRLKSLLPNILKEDKFNCNDGYIIRSLYFDTIYNNDFLDKENGLENRRKIRIRTYNLDTETIKLEIKEKKGDLQCKSSLLISKEVGESLIKGKYEVLKEYDNDLAKELYAIMSLECYRPKCIIEYKRNAYILLENNIRITIDENIRGTEESFDIFSDNLNLNNILDSTVLEVKYNNFLFSYIKDLLCLVDSDESSISKYWNCRNTMY